MAFLLKLGGCLLLAAVLIVGFAWWWLFTLPVSQSTLKQLTPGMSQAQVHSILGAANHTNVWNGEVVWYYSHKPSAVCLIVWFSTSGRFKEYVID